MARATAKSPAIIKTDLTEKEKYQIEEEVRFDIISIILNAHEVKINHIEEAFTDNW